MKNILIGDTKVEGNFEVSGTQTILNTETILTKDGLIGVNSPPVAGSDSGILIERYPDFTGVLSAVTPTSAQIAQIAEPGWIIAVNEIYQEIISVSGTTINVNWSPQPNNGDVYKLFKFRSAGFFYKPSTEKFYAGYTAQSHLDSILQLTPGVLSVSRIEQMIGEQPWYVGKHGHDSLSGRTIGEAKLTFGAITSSPLYSGELIICLDDGIYAETATVSKLFAPNATITGLQLSGYANCGYFTNCNISAPSNLTFIDGGQIICSSTANVSGGSLSGITGITCSGEIFANIKKFDNLTSVSCSGVANIIAEKSLSPTLTAGTGVIYFLASKINSFSGTGTVYAVDAQSMINHINSTSNPHSVTFDQVSPLTVKGSLITSNGISTEILAPGVNGSYLRANSATASGLEWSALTSLKSFMLHSDITLVNSNSFITIAYFTWKQSEFSSFAPGKLIFNTSGMIDLKFTDGITDYISGSFSGFCSQLMSSNPVADTILMIQVKKNSSSEQIKGISLIF